MEFLRDLFGFITERKKWWLLPLIITLLFLGAIIIFAEGSPIGAFLYTLF